jgi:hypothetical protein
MNVFPLLAALTVVYCVVIAGLTLALRRLHIGGDRAIVLAFLIFGALSGLLAAWVWPLDSAVYANVYAVFLGDQIYTWAIHYLGDPHSANAHDTIPSLLRVPQVYILASLVASGTAGVVVQRIYDLRTAGELHGQ